MKDERNEQAERIGWVCIVGMFENSKKRKSKANPCIGRNSEARRLKLGSVAGLTRRIFLCKGVVRGLSEDGPKQECTPPM